MRRRARYPSSIPKTVSELRFSSSPYFSCKRRAAVIVSRLSVKRRKSLASCQILRVGWAAVAARNAAGGCPATAACSPGNAIHRCESSDVPVPLTSAKLDRLALRSNREAKHRGDVCDSSDTRARLEGPREASRVPSPARLQSQGGVVQNRSCGVRQRRTAAQAAAAGARVKSSWWKISWPNCARNSSFPIRTILSGDAARRHLSMLRSYTRGRRVHDRQRDLRHDLHLPVPRLPRGRTTGGCSGSLFSCCRWRSSATCSTATSHG